MKAYKFLTKTTDFARIGLKPLINHVDEGIYTNLTDFIYECYLRFTGIKELQPRHFRTGVHRWCGGLCGTSPRH